MLLVATFTELVFTYVDTQNSNNSIKQVIQRLLYPHYHRPILFMIFITITRVLGIILECIFIQQQVLTPKQVGLHFKFVSYFFSLPTNLLNKYVHMGHSSSLFFFFLFFPCHREPEVLSVTMFPCKYRNRKGFSFCRLF